MTSVLRPVVNSVPQHLICDVLEAQDTQVTPNPTIH
jgi:hypothetical protein